MTTNKSPLREKPDIPEGEAEIQSIPEKYEKAQEIGRTSDNTPTIDEIELSKDRVFVVNIRKKSGQETEGKKVAASAAGVISGKKTARMMRVTTMLMMIDTTMPKGEKRK
jgi:hypothetical protein